MGLVLTSVTRSSRREQSTASQYLEDKASLASHSQCAGCCGNTPAVWLGQGAGSCCCTKS